MPAARYWRIVAIDTYSGGDLELSEVALYETATRVDGSATVSSTIAPVTGALSALSDGSFSTSVRWDGDDVRLPGFAVVWDFGAGVTKNIIKVGLASVSRSTAASRASLEYSADGFVWEGMGSAAFGYVNATVLAESDRFDPHFQKVALLLHCRGIDGSTTVTDSSPSPKTAYRVGGAKIVAAPFTFSGACLYCDGVDDAITFANDPSLQFGTGDFTIEFWVRTNKASQSNGFPRILAKGLYQTAGAWNLTYIKSSGALVFDIYTAGATALGISCGIVPDDSRVYIEISRSGNKVSTYMNGVKHAEGVNSTNLSSSDVLAICGVSNLSASGMCAAYVDGIRITPGVGRNTSNYIPPQSEHFDGQPTPGEPLRSVWSGSVRIDTDIVGTTQHVTYPQPSQFDVYDAGRGRIVGTVKEKSYPANAPLMRKVVLLSMPGSRAIRETWSDPVTGVYTFDEVAMDRVYTVVSYDHTGIYRGVVADNLTPEAMP